MSERGPAPRPASHHRTSPKSPPRESPPSSQLGVHARDDGQREALPPFDPASVATTHGERTPYILPRTIGVHNILNPSETQAAYAGAAPHASSRAAAAGPESGSSPSGMALGQQAGGSGPPPQPFTFHGQAAAMTGQPGSSSSYPPSANPPGPPPPPPPPASLPERMSPTYSHPQPALGAPRRTLTPRSPRASSGLGRAMSFTPYASQSLSRGGANPQDVPPVPPPPLPGVHRPGSGGGAQRPGGVLAPVIPPPSTVAALATPPRSLSQPIFGHFQQQQQQQQQQHQAQDVLQQNLTGREQQQQQQQARPLPPFQSGTTFGPGLPHSRALVGGGPTGDGQWSTTLMRQSGGGGPGGGGRTASMSDAQPFITIMPHAGEEIRVLVDTQQASKQADEKRLRNAGASARFRARKKEKDREAQVGIQRLEGENRDLKSENQRVKAERDWYKSERTRLLKAMQADPKMREIAESGPPSPSSTRSGGSFAESSPMSVPSLPQPGPSAIPTYVTDPSSHERPARRRRTDPSPALEFHTPSYGPAPGTSLPPIPPHPGYSMAPSPLSGSPGNQRLPPLRMDPSSVSPTSEHPPGLPVPMGPTHPPGPPPSYPPYTRPYETGWATGPPTSGPRPPFDPNQQQR